MGTGYQIYAQEYNDYIPNSRYPEASWQYKVGGTGVLGELRTEEVVHWNWTSIWNRGIYQGLKCPGDLPGRYAGTGGAADGRSFARYQTSYTMSSYDQNWSISRHDYASERLGWSRGPTDISSQSDARIQIDSATGNSTSYYLSDVDSLADPTYFNAIQFGFRHPGETVNCLYWDGHVDNRAHYSSTGEKIYQELYKIRIRDEG